MLEADPLLTDPAGNMSDASDAVCRRGAVGAGIWFSERQQCRE